MTTETATSLCVHHWRIEPAGQGKRRVHGECRKCGATRDFLAAEPADYTFSLANPLGTYAQRTAPVVMEDADE